MASRYNTKVSVTMTTVTMRQKCTIATWFEASFALIRVCDERRTYVKVRTVEPHYKEPLGTGILFVIRKVYQYESALGTEHLHREIRPL